MKRIIYITFCCTVSFLISTISAQAMADVKAATRVKTNQVTMGDLFNNLDKGHDIWVADAPNPGKRISIQTQYLARLTRQHGIQWRNKRALQNIVVTRDSASVKYGALKKLIKEELDIMLSDGQKREIAIYNSNSRLHFPEENGLSDLYVKNLNLDERSGKFSATIMAPAGENRESQNKISGRFYEVSYVPTLNKTLGSGAEITERDISWQAVPTLKLGRNIVLSKDQILGMTGKRALKSSTPIRLSDLERPQVVKRGSLVRIMFSAGKITLSTTGKASEHGGRGDIIRVTNLSSHKTIEAVVLGPNKVQVVTHNSDLALLSGNR